MNTSRGVYIALLVHAGLIGIGAVGTWATFLFVSIGGFQTRDGKLVLLLAAASAVLVLLAWGSRRDWPLVLALLALLAAGAFGAYDWYRLQDRIDGVAATPSTTFKNPFADSISVGWGLMLLTVAGLTPLFSLAAIAWTQRQDEPIDPSDPSDPSDEDAVSPRLTNRRDRAAHAPK